MELGSFLIVLLIFFLSGFYVLRPIFVGSSIGGRAGSTKRDSLVAERERLLNSIEELDLELELKKISDAEHARNRDILLSDAAKVLKELDELPRSKTGKRKKAASPKDSDDLEKMIAERRKQIKGEKSFKCAHCGESVEQDAQYCSHCGGALQ